MSEQWMGPHTCQKCGRTISTSNHRVCSTCRGRMARGVSTDTPITTPLRGSLKERFQVIWETLTPDDNGCLVWPRQKGGGKGRNYGWIIAPGKKMMHAHRVSYEVHKGEIPEDMVVTRVHDNPPCVNPDHLSLGTRQDNSRDMAAKGRNSGLSDKARAARWVK